MLGCQMSFTGRRSRRLGVLREREECLGADGVYEQLSPEDHYLSCKFKVLCKLMRETSNETVQIMMFAVRTLPKHRSDPHPGLK
jgi:hypothetical protein